MHDAIQGDNDDEIVCNHTVWGGAISLFLSIFDETRIGDMYQSGMLQVILGFMFWDRR
jgi:hypothetical protein